MIGKIVIIISLLSVICSLGLAQGNVESKVQGLIITLDGPTKSLVSPIFIIKADSLIARFERSEFMDDSSYIDPKWIQVINVMRDEEAMLQYGKPGENGAVIIELKKEALDSLPLSLRAKFDVK